MPTILIEILPVGIISRIVTFNNLRKVTKNNKLEAVTNFSGILLKYMAMEFCGYYNTKIRKMS